jgi:hypothetical protein
LYKYLYGNIDEQGNNLDGIVVQRHQGFSKGCPQTGR